MDKQIILPTDFVTVTKTNHIIEVQHMEKMNTQANIKKIDKHRYLDLKTGEVKEFEHIENRQQSYNSLRQTFKKLRYLINNNFEGKPNELHCTLTYKENMTDTKRLYTDTNRFLMRLKRKYGDIDYINVPEPQERGAWHNHMLIRFNGRKNVYIPNKWKDKDTPIDAPLYDMWEQGYVTIKSLKDVDNIGAYLSAYLSDVELTDKNIMRAFENQNTITVRQVDGQEKKFIKGGRLHLYPPGMNLIRKSRGIQYPERRKMKYSEVKKIVGSAQPHYEKSYHIENGDFQNTIHYKQYNMKRV